MPLGVRPPIGPLDYLKGPPDGDASPAVREFLGSLAMASVRLEGRGIDTSRLLTVFDISLRSVKKIEQADFVAGVTGDSDEASRTFVNRKVDPRDSHPLFPKQVLELVGELHGKRFSQPHFTALERHHGWRDQDHLCYDDPEASSVRWSREIVAQIKNVSAVEYAAACKAYFGYRQRQKQAKKTISAA